MLHNTDVGSVQPNREVWNENLCIWICPGKGKLVGRDQWTERAIRGVDFSGRRLVQRNFVIGSK